MRKYLVRDIMTTNPISVQEDMSVKKCAELMVAKGVGSLIVMKKESFAGILTEQDMVLKVVALNIDPNKLLAKDIMTSAKGIINVDPSRSVYTAMILMNNNDIRRLPVIEDGSLKGIITMKDIFGIEPDLFDNMFDFVLDHEKENE